MKENKNKEQECCTCQADFRNEVNELVDNVKGYTHKDHREKKKEVEAAFEQDKQDKE